MLETRDGTPEDIREFVDVGGTSIRWQCQQSEGVFRIQNLEYS